MEARHKDKNASSTGMEVRQKYKNVGSAGMEVRHECEVIWIDSAVSRTPKLRKVNSLT